MVPLVIYIIFRFSAKVREGEVCGPMEIIISDIPFQLTIALWILVIVLIIYGGNSIAGYRLFPF